MEFHMKENGYTTQLGYGELHISRYDEHGYRPYQLLVSSVAVCSGSVLGQILEKQRIEVDDINIKTDVVQNSETDAHEIQKIHMHFRIKGKNLKSKKIEKALELTRKNCTIVQSVKDSIDITETFEIV